jgi:hypothetical protein
LLIPLGTRSTFFKAVGATDKQRSPRRWALPPSISNIDATTPPKSSHTSLLSTNPREEQANAPKALSVDAKPFQPRPTLNVHMPNYDPFGKIADFDSSQSTHEFYKWKETLINNSLICNEELLETSYGVAGLTDDTSVGWPAEEEVSIHPSIHPQHHHHHTSILHTISGNLMSHTIIHILILKHTNAIKVHPGPLRMHIST